MSVLRFDSQMHDRDMAGPTMQTTMNNLERGLGAIISGKSTAEKDWTRGRLKVIETVGLALLDDPKVHLYNKSAPFSFIHLIYALVTAPPSNATPEDPNPSSPEWKYTFPLGPRFLEESHYAIFLRNVINHLCSTGALGGHAQRWQAALMKPDELHDPGFYPGPCVEELSTLMSMIEQQVEAARAEQKQLEAARAEQTQPTKDQPTTDTPASDSSDSDTDDLDSELAAVDSAESPSSFPDYAALESRLGPSSIAVEKDGICGMPSEVAGEQMATEISPARREELRIEDDSVSHASRESPQASLKVDSSVPSEDLLDRFNSAGQFLVPDHSPQPTHLDPDHSRLHEYSESPSVERSSTSVSHHVIESQQDQSSASLSSSPVPPPTAFFNPTPASRSPTASRNASANSEQAEESFIGEIDVSFDAASSPSPSPTRSTGRPLQNSRSFSGPMDGSGIFSSTSERREFDLDALTREEKILLVERILSSEEGLREDIVWDFVECRPHLHLVSLENDPTELVLNEQRFVSAEDPQQRMDMCKSVLLTDDNDEEKAVYALLLNEVFERQVRFGALRLVLQSKDGRRLTVDHTTGEYYISPKSDDLMRCLDALTSHAAARLFDTKATKKFLLSALDVLVPFFFNPSRATYPFKKLSQALAVLENRPHSLVKRTQHDDIVLHIDLMVLMGLVCLAQHVDLGPEVREMAIVVANLLLFAGAHLDALYGSHSEPWTVGRHVRMYTMVTRNLILNASPGGLGKGGGQANSIFAYLGPLAERMLGLKSGQRIVSSGGSGDGESVSAEGSGKSQEEPRTTLPLKPATPILTVANLTTTIRKSNGVGGTTPDEKEVAQQMIVQARDACIVGVKSLLAPFLEDSKAYADLCARLSAADTSAPSPPASSSLPPPTPAPLTFAVFETPALDAADVAKGASLKRKVMGLFSRRNKVDLNEGKQSLGKAAKREKREQENAEKLGFPRRC